MVASFGGECCAKIEIPVSPLFQPVELAAGSDIDLRYMDTPTDEPSPAMTITPRKISKTKAVLLSMLLPGAGHFYLGEKGRGEVFIGAEVASWVGAAAFQFYGDWKEDDYKRYAQEHAGISPGDKSEEFYTNLTFYDSREEYNTSGRVIDPNDPYYPNTPDYYWQWDNEDSKGVYRDMRNDSETAYRNRDFAIGVAIANRIISSIDAFRLARKIIGRRADQFGGGEDGNKEGVKFGVDANPFGDNKKFILTVTSRF